MVGFRRGGAGSGAANLLRGCVRGNAPRSRRWHGATPGQGRACPPSTAQERVATRAPSLAEPGLPGGGTRQPGRCDASGAARRAVCRGVLTRSQLGDVIRETAHRKGLRHGGPAARSRGAGRGICASVQSGPWVCVGADDDDAWTIDARGAGRTAAGPSHPDPSHPGTVNGQGNGCCARGVFRGHGGQVRLAVEAGGARSGALRELAPLLRPVLPRAPPRRRSARPGRGSPCAAVLLAAGGAAQWPRAAVRGSAQPAAPSASRLHRPPRRRMRRGVGPGGFR